MGNTRSKIGCFRTDVALCVWLDRAEAQLGTDKANNMSNQKYTCPDCGLNAWAKPGVRLICGECEVELAAGLALP